MAVTTLEAPSGFGKSTALAQCIKDNEARPAGYDVYISCRRSHRDPMLLTAAILSEFGRPALSGELDHQELVDAWTGAISRFSPDAVCLHLDDLHLLSDSDSNLSDSDANLSDSDSNLSGSDSNADGVVKLLADVVRQLPRNGHLVFAGRTLPRLPLARLLAADQAIAIQADDLAFTTEEVGQLADHHAGDVASLAPMHGWPAMTRLALAVGPDATEEFLIDEVVDQLAPAAREALAAMALGWSVDRELMALVGVDIDLASLATQVPLVRPHEHGWYGVHDLWVEQIDRLVDTERASEILDVIVPWHSNAGRHDQAVSIAAAAGRWTLAGRAVISALGDGDVGTTAETTQRWLALFPESKADEPELLFLRGMDARLEHGAGHGVDEVARALDLFEERGDVHAAATAAFERGFQGWLANDTDAILDVLGRAPGLIEAGASQLIGLGRLADAAIYEMAGDFQAAFNASASVDFSRLPRAFAELTARYTATMAFLIGDSARGVSEIERVYALDPSPRNEFVLTIARFEHGDPAAVLSDWPTLRYSTAGNRRDDFWMMVFSCVVDASLGLEPRAEQVRRQAWDRSREKAFAAIVSAAAAVIDGDEEKATAHIEGLIDDLSLSDGLAEGELRRFLPYGYVLSSTVRAHYDDPAIDPPLGARHRKQLSLAKALLAIRSGEPVDWSGYETPEAALCVLPLPWTVELACGLVTADAAAGSALADYLLTNGTHTDQQLRRCAASANKTIAAGATTILTSLANPPDRPTRLQGIGDLLIDHGEGPTRPSRARVRQLLALLVLRPSVTRQEAAELLWPGRKRDAARNNLRITLAHLRRELEPDRQAQEPTFHLRHNGDRLMLHRNDALIVDLWTVLDDLETARLRSAKVSSRAAMAALESAVRLWSGPILPDLREVDALRPELQALDQRLFDAGIDLAQWLLSDGQLTEARVLAERLFELEPMSEPARGVLIAVYLEDGDLAAAGQAIDEYTAVLRAAGREPGPTIRMLTKRYEVTSAA
ncbi:MAG: AfsR/SARP family transcriptional regulator [Acidimicrobiales bacterium]